MKDVECLGWETLSSSLPEVWDLQGGHLRF